MFFGIPAGINISKSDRKPMAFGKIKKISLVLAVVPIIGAVLVWALPRYGLVNNATAAYIFLVGAVSWMGAVVFLADWLRCPVCKTSLLDLFGQGGYSARFPIWLPLLWAAKQPCKKCGHLIE